MVPHTMHGKSGKAPQAQPWAGSLKETAAGTGMPRLGSLRVEADAFPCGVCSLNRCIFYITAGGRGFVPQEQREVYGPFR